MKRKIMMYFVTSIIIVTSIFAFLTVMIFQYKAEKNMISFLNNKNKYILNLIKDSLQKQEIELLKTISRDNEIRITILDAQGKLYYDSWENYRDFKLENGEYEIVEATENGHGTVIRENFMNHGKVLCVAVKDGESGYIVRSCINSSYFNVMDEDVLNYFLIIIFLIVMVALWISNKMTFIIVEPIKYLDHITTRFSMGEMNRRSTLKSKDEIGSLSEKFNTMADSIEKNMNKITESNNKLQSILNSMRNGLLAIDRAGRIIIINSCAKEIFGIETEVLGKCIYNEVGQQNIIDIFSHSQEESEITIDYPTKRNIKIKRTDIINKGDYLGVVAVLEDITEFKKLEDMRIQFVSNVSHELKTPLTSIMGFAETLRQVQDEPTRERFLNIINSEAERLTSLIEDTMALSKLDSGVDVVENNFIIDEALDEVINLLCIKANKSNIRLLKHGIIGFQYKGDRNKFKQMMINIIDNAIKYSNEGSDVEIFCEEEETLFKITVKDHGIGIEEEDLKYIFQRFYRVDKARSRDSGGTGLGLAIVKHIIALFDGKIDVKSSIGNGSEFAVTMYKNRKPEKALNVL
ncbi:two-component system, OmpR family, phosphate regulon sensor histidine kinase PhoR [Hathewaya proteolytica DSM 3090]|uniref:histidine kinase n=1 Tax=Hathewaya proteolytica DSM 3090 TaxID=1121331 RepID=A0A1M6JBN6_9CLOT|nr:HAMP domain-containing histidine kinase [Hathewaya proteolytica]SHJ44073.1 two-component system, OmpR family, phosphate regulon sensor histidine kinase PhoR [Hathewaya proteolytica DSM 3090]